MKSGKFIVSDEVYKNWIADLSNRYQKSQIKASISVNSEMLMFYWSLGRDIVQMDAENKYGSNFFQVLSNDLKRVIPAVKCFSTTNLRYMKRFYELTEKMNATLPQVGEESKQQKNFINSMNIEERKLPQPGAILMCIPWGHIKILSNRCKDTPEKALFYSQKIIEHN